MSRLIDQQLVRALTAPGPVEPGVTRSWSVELDGGLVAELSVNIRRKVSAADHHDHVAGALAELQKHPYRAVRCCVEVNRGAGRFARRPEGQCSGKVSLAVAMEFGGYQFVCARHRENHGFNAARVLGVVTLPAAELAALRQLAAEQHAEAVRLDEAQRVARLAAALPAFADPVGMEGWTYHAGQRRWHREARVAGSHRVTTMVILLTDSADVGWEIKDGPEDAPRLRTALAWGVVDTRAEAIAALLREAR